MKLNEDDLRTLGYVCTECGRVSNRLKACPNGCTKICPDCLRSRGQKNFVFCKTCGNMTMKSWRST